jgi:rod shape-determining protein MreD
VSVRSLNPSIFTALWLLPVLGVFQASLMGHLALLGTVPGIMLIVIVDWGILRGMDEGMMWALVGGLCLDVFSGWPIGTNMVALVIVASIVSLGQGTFIRTHAFLPVATVFAATILYYLVVLFILESTRHPVDWIAALQVIVLPIALYNAAINVVGFRLVRRFEARIYPVPRAHW